MKKMIAVCTTKINDEFSRNYIDMIHRLADPQKYGIAVFHSVYDFFNRTVEMGARTIFRMIPYDKISAVVILRDAIFDKSLIDRIIGEATANSVPIIMARGLDPRCYSIEADFEGAYEELLQSVIKTQGRKDTFYIAGRKSDDPDSERRLSVYRKVLEENGCVFDPTRVEYGEYWETPTLRAINNMFDKLGRSPEAIFCANDIMAFTVMEKLREKDVRIPEDTAVTGFDGLENSKYCTPSLSSCSEDTSVLAEITMTTIEKLTNGEQVPSVQRYPYRTVLRQSTDAEKTLRPEDLDTQLFYRMRIDEINERNYNSWLDTVIAMPNIENLRRNMPAMTLDGFSVCIRADAFLDEDADVKADFPNEYLTVRRNERDMRVEKLIPSNELIYRFFKYIPDGHIGLFSMISNSNFVYGAAFTPTNDLQTDAQKINRYIKTLNRALNVGLSGERQRKQVGEHYKKIYIDALTGLFNIDGANKWFSNAVLNDFTHSNHLSVGVYTFINYQQVLDKYGTYVLEENMQYLAKSLKLANPEDAVLARISADSFAVLLLRTSGSITSETIDSAINLFYGYLDIRNKSKDKISDMEISCGYTDSITPWEGKLTDYLNAAISNLYRNRVSFEKHLPSSVDLRDSAQLLEYRATFLSLLNDNLFTYHFQPIVDARSGEIIAYEALMRTKGEIRMSPLDVLSAATMFCKLDQIEYMSFHNIYSCITEQRERFGDRLVFINTIPGHFLSAEYCDEIITKYGDLLSQSVIEITESETISISELDAIRTFGGNRSNIRIAVDDYGTGHSNIVNLIEYKPQIVKIDRYLITNISTDKNKQMFVKNLIEFSNENNIKVLAEGVETLDELQTVIDFGVDYIQGYYTAKPNAELLHELPEKIKRQIVERAAAKAGR